MMAVVAMLPAFSFSQSFHVPAPQLPPWASNAPSNTAEVSVFHQGTLVVGQASFRMGNDGVFDKPIILVEGFDFGSGWRDDVHGFGTVTWHGIFGGDPENVPAGLDYRPLLDELHACGADVVFLDFEFGTASLQAKSALLRHVIGLTNAYRQGILPGILVGVSMGGVVGRMALTSMEHEQQDHCIGQFYSIDAPHLGAVMPVGFQALVLGLSSQSENGMQLWQALNSVAARQLLRHHIADDNTFLETQLELHQSGWPATPHNLAIINSRENALAELTSAPLLRIEWGVSAPFNSSLFYVQADRWSSSQSQGGASYLLPGDLNPWSDAGIVQTGSYIFTQPPSDEESLPGSQATHLTQMVNAMNAQFAPLQVVHQTLQSGVTFVPYSSALGEDEGTDAPWLARSESGDVEPREDHATLAAHHRTFVLEWVNGLWNEIDEIDTVFNQATSLTFGWDIPALRTLPNVTVVEQGRIHIGNSDDPFLTHTSACHGRIEVSNEGALLVGGPDGSKGRLNVVQGSEVIAAQHGEIVVYPGSMLNLCAGAQLNLSNAKLHILPGARVTFQPGSAIVLSDGALITLAPNAKLDLHGEVHLQQDASALVTSSGRVSWASGSELTTLPLSSLQVEQSYTGICTISGDVGWLGSGNFKLQGGSLELEPNSTLNVDASLFLENTSIQTLANTTCFNTSGDVTAHHIQVSDLSWSHDGSSNSQTSSVRLLDSQWSNSNCSIHQSKVLMWRNHFDESHMRVSGALSFSRIVQNEWNAPWNDILPCLHLLTSDNRVMLRENHWRGGIGFRATESVFLALCNVWEFCTEAVILEELSEGCFVSRCGGGGNSWSSNDVHVALMESSLPELSNSNNQFGHAYEWIAKGITTSNVSEWIVHGANWETSPAQVATPSSIYLNTDVRRWTEGGHIDVPWQAADNIEWLTCEEYRQSKPFMKKNATFELTNILGQEIQTQEFRSNAVMPPLKTDD